MNENGRAKCLSGHGVTKLFGIGNSKVVAVDHVDFDFREGDIISIVGGSGSGKTTLSKMLLGLIAFQKVKSSFKERPGILKAMRRRESIGKGYRQFSKIPFLPTTCSIRLILSCLTVST